MNYSEFKAKYVKGVDLDGVYGMQCVDLAQAYINEIAGTKDKPINAINYADSTRQSKLKALGFTIIKSSKDLKQGDIVVLNLTVYGHVALVDKDYSGDSKIYVWGQNQTSTDINKGSPPSEKSYASSYFNIAYRPPTITSIAVNYSAVAKTSNNIYNLRKTPDSKSGIIETTIPKGTTVVLVYGAEKVDNQGNKYIATIYGNYAGWSTMS
jgi:hypothetical protein